MRLSRSTVFVAGALLGLGGGITAALIAQPAPNDDSVVEINLKADARPSKKGLRGQDKSGQWTGVLKQHKFSKPRTAGDVLTIIEVYEHTGDPEDLQNPDGSSAHGHGGSDAARTLDPPYNTHCHQWVKIGQTWYQVHCGV